jgi:ubiquinone/menaquinone biosynthesis C-methylase UbiE
MKIGSLVKNISIARSGVYFLESLPFMFANRWISKSDLGPPTPEQNKLMWPHIVALHEREAMNIDQGIYPLKALEIENPIRHARSFVEVMGDGLRVAWRMRNNKNKDFSGKAAEVAENMPDYYARNFHFQTDGYFSEASARRYDHQVEILFGGTAGAMRRTILPVLKNDANNSGRWLEIGCGAGSATRSVLATFPKTRVTALDLSASYLKVAQETLREFDNVDFVQGDGTKLEFKDETFDAVYSVYLLHEMPRVEREKVVAEAFRVLKPGGLLLFADSLQLNDDPELNWALERFPKVYHEPFYANYSKDRMEDLLNRMTGAETFSDKAFLTKLCWLHKPSSSRES